VLFKHYRCADDEFGVTRSHLDCGRLIRTSVSLQARIAGCAHIW
jgi:hypothetical protein